MDGGNCTPGVSHFVGSPNVTMVNVSKACNITGTDTEHMHNLQSDLCMGGGITLTSILTKRDVSV